MSTTPLTDFIATLADPATLERFLADPFTTAAQAGLSQEVAELLVSGHPGAIRVHAIRELERAGLAPLVSDRFTPEAPHETGAVALPPSCAVPLANLPPSTMQPPANPARSARATIFPMSIPPIPASAFPIASQEDLLKKLYALFLRAPHRADTRHGVAAPPLGTRPDDGGDQHAETSS